MPIVLSKAGVYVSIREHSDTMSKSEWFSFCLFLRVFVVLGLFTPNVFVFILVFFIHNTLGLF